MVSTTSTRLTGNSPLITASFCMQVMDYREGREGREGKGTMHSQCLKGLRKLKSGHRMIFTICESDSWHLAITILVAFVMSLCSN